MPTWEDFDAAGRETFQKLRTPGIGEQMILEDNMFIERVPPRNIIRKLTDEEMAIYRAPFPTPGSRVPTWRFPNELLIAGEPADVYSTIEHAHMAQSRSSYPKLLFVGDPGALVPPVFADGSQKSSMTVGSYILARVFTTCRRIIRKQ
jgi:haloalkane dehalogenase